MVNTNHQMTCGGRWSSLTKPRNRLLVDIQAISGLVRASMSLRGNVLML